MEAKWSALVTRRVVHSRLVTLSILLLIRAIEQTIGLNDTVWLRLCSEWGMGCSQIWLQAVKVRTEMQFLEEVFLAFATFFTSALLLFIWAFSRKAKISRPLINENFLKSKFRTIPIFFFFFLMVSCLKSIYSETFCGRKRKFEEKFKTSPATLNEPQVRFSIECFTL